MSELMSKSAILSRSGWTTLAIRLFLPTPDKIVPNPIYNKKPPMNLYLRERVKAIEKTDIFKDFVKTNKKN